jgi:hypothetical protein
MSLNYNLCDDWGWYIDIEKSASASYKKKQFIKYQLQDSYTTYDDNEFMYYLHLNKNYYNLEYNLEYNLVYNSDKNNHDKEDGNYMQTTLNIVSTAMIVVVLTYTFMFI